MAKSYNFNNISVTDQEVARYERQIEDEIDISVGVEEGPYSSIDIDGDLIDPYGNDTVLDNSDEEKQLAMGVAFGRHIFEELSDYQLDQEPLIRPIFSDIDPSPIKEAGKITDLEDSDYFRHGFLNQREISEDLGFYQIEDIEGITQTQEEFYNSVQEVLEDEDLSASEITERISDGEIEVDVGSAKHRSWTANVLNELSDRGLVGRYRDGREVKFTGDPERGFRGQVINSDLGLEQKNNLIHDRERPVTEREIQELSGRGRQPVRIMDEFAKRASWEAINK